MLKCKNTQHEHAPVITYRCYIGCEEMATPVWVAGHGAMVITGQFMPRTGISDIMQSISSIGRRRPSQSEVSSEFWRWITEFQLPESLWTDINIGDQNKQFLIQHASTLKPRTDEDALKLVREAQRIGQIAEQYYRLEKNAIESAIVQRVGSAIRDAACAGGPLWPRISTLLTVVRQAMNLRYMAFLAGDKESDSVLTLKAHSGTLTALSDPSAPLQFNWRKAGLLTRDERDTSRQTFDADEMRLTHLEFLMGGFRGPNRRVLADAAAIVPLRLTHGMMGVIVVGPHVSGAQLNTEEAFLFSVCRDVSSRILTLRLGDLLREERADWEKAAKLTGHRVRASLQSVGSQLNTLRDSVSAPGRFSDAEVREAREELKGAFRELTEISYAAESNVRGVIDVGIARREHLSLADIVWAAAEAQADLAEEAGIDVAISGMHLAGDVFGNRTLLKIAFINLVNNALKYSLPPGGDRARVVKIKPPTPDLPGDVAAVEIVNYGMGIKECDYTRIFEWGVRLVEDTRTFRGRYGRGIGLWECKHIVEGHGGKIFVQSAHGTGANVTDDNIRQCLTVFTVILPTA